MNVIEGGGAGNFPLLAAAALAAGSFSTDGGISSARFSSPPALLLLCGGVGMAAPNVNHGLTAWAGQGDRLDEGEAFIHAVIKTWIRSVTEYFYRAAGLCMFAHGDNLLLWVFIEPQ